MLRFERIVIHIFILLLINTTVNAAHLRESSWGLLSKILNKNYRSPIILVLNPKSIHDGVLRSNDKGKVFSEKQLKRFDDKIDDIDAMYWLKAILRSTGDQNDPLVQKTNDKFESALRSRCSSYYECTVNCTKKKKPKPSCTKSCKDVFDYLMMCNPPGGMEPKKKPKKKDSCEEDSCAESDQCGKEMNCKPIISNTYGKTMPPKWRL